MSDPVAIPSNFDDLVVNSRIESAIFAILDADKFTATEIGRDLSTICSPSADVAVVSGKYEVLGNQLKSDHRIIIGLWVKNTAQDERFRRREAHKLALWLCYRLHNQDLGLPIQPLNAVDWRETTTAQELSACLMHIETEFTTKSSVALPDPDDAAAMLEWVMAGYHMVEPATGQMSGNAQATDNLNSGAT